ncbi:MAG TPA: glycerol-3-phosphate acyltransferase [Anaerolineales bacterium]|nr:glycerol-3-phosphate acyltransferase [Anaerolineales bacterium]
MSAAWILTCFLVGSIPFALVLGRVFVGVDIRTYGDGNPGAANLWRAAGWPLGLLAFFLDFLKGALPVGLAQFVGGLHGWPLALAGLAPILGHAYSPFLRFRGGKALAVTLGVWTGLTLFAMPLVAGLSALIFYLTVTPEGWAVTFALVCMLAYLVSSGSDPVLLAVWLGSVPVLLERHRRDLRQRPRWRPRRTAEVPPS